MTPPTAPNELEERLIDHIGRYGPITFEAFMEAALYDEHLGYYPSRRRQPGSTPVGTDGDYFTSPVTHPAFGALLALQLREMWQRLGSPGEFVVVEMGAGDGVLRTDITEYTERELPDFAKAMQYVATDLVPPAGSESVAGTDELPTGITGCVVSNELLDAHPVNRFIIQAGSVKEIFVDYRDGTFVEVVQDVVEPEVEARVLPFVRSLPDSYRGEVNLRLGYWSDSVSATLDSGYVITVDYGFDRPDLYAPTRLLGSLRCYYQHTLGQDPLRRIGKQDITAHVDFTAVDHTLAVNGFTRVANTTQSEFLTNLGIEDFLSDVGERPLRKELSRPEFEEDTAGIGTLIDPEGLGRFRVAVHSRGAASGLEIKREQVAGHTGLTGLDGGPSLATGHAAPLLQTATADHARLLRAGNPFSQSRPQIENMPTWEQLFSDEP
ncbi:MAG: SAM-dependent methyltransferase [Chloroflexi bacterium]|nr:SAM-dependent methyltransferase [Chloroflexota bacterium]